jgi:hypothetical protein
LEKEPQGHLVSRLPYFIDALHRPQPGDEVAHTMWPTEWTRRRLAVLQQALDKRRASGLEVLFTEHPAPELRVPREEAYQVEPRVSHPGFDEKATAAAKQV